MFHVKSTKNHNDSVRDAYRERESEAAREREGERGHVCICVCSVYALCFGHTLLFIKIVIHIKYLWITGQKYMDEQT